MEAKLKAEELVDKYNFLKQIFIPSIHEQKQCALIAVDEILQYIGEEDFIYPSPQFEYWQEVKKEIELL